MLILWNIFYPWYLHKLYKHKKQSKVLWFLAYGKPLGRTR